MITWLVVGLLLFTESACDRGKNAVSNKNGKNGSAADKPSNAGAPAKATAGSDEEDIYRLTCYTCVNVSDNKMCNEWAIDTPCPDAVGDFCRSLHILDSRGQSVLVSKSCANKNECSPASVGCVPVDTQKICISCCDTSYCNVESPTNATSATYSRKRLDRAKGLKKKKKKKKKGSASSGDSSSSSSSSKDEAPDDNDDDDDEDADDASRAASQSFSSSLSLQRLGLATAFSAISVFLNRAYH